MLVLATVAVKLDDVETGLEGQMPATAWMTYRREYHEITCVYMQVYIYGSCGVEGGEFGGKAAANTHVLASNHERLIRRLAFRGEGHKLCFPNSASPILSSSYSVAEPEPCTTTMDYRSADPQLQLDVDTMTLDYLFYKGFETVVSERLQYAAGSYPDSDLALRTVDCRFGCRHVDADRNFIAFQSGYSVRSPFHAPNSVSRLGRTADRSYSSGM
ncbi:hypothetical protein M8818_000046 [Zalaria obscura]|uniref:Uncharacterized protein n=1 Tax=Zalaria obscura TaxID=2024903 RepID=A0ACC3SNW4_9PEZI